MLTPVSVEEYPALNTGSVVTLLVAIGLVLVLWIFVLVKILKAKSANIAWLLLASHMTSAVVCGVSTWAVTYTAARSQIDESITELIVIGGDVAAVKLVALLNEAGRAVNLVADSLRDTLGPMPGYPHAHIILKNAFNSVDRGGGEVTGIYYGQESGAFFGVRPLRYATNKAVDPGWEIYAGTGASNIERRCPGHDRCTLLPACPSPIGGCGFCPTNAGIPEGPQCAGWVPAIRGKYPVPDAVGEWDVPPPEADRRYCVPNQPPFSTHQAEEGVVSSHEGQFLWNSSKGRTWHRSETCWGHYDSRLRPWYIESGNLSWSSVYEFASGVSGESVSFGITGSRAIRNLYWEGVPWMGGTPPNSSWSPWAGVVGVDVTVSSVSGFLREGTPTPNAVVFFVQIGPEEGVIAASSLPPAEMAGAHAKSADWKWRSLFERIEDAYGGLTEAANSEPKILQHNSGTVLVTPVTPVGGRWLLVLYIPYSDTLDDTEDASTAALSTAIAVCIATGLVLFVCVGFALKPYFVMLKAMHSVSLMELEDLKLQRSWIKELEVMREYLLQMVENLRWFRDFMPQSLITIEPPEEDNSPLASERPGSVKVKTGARRTSIASSNLPTPSDENTGSLRSVPVRPVSRMSVQSLIPASGVPVLSIEHQTPAPLVKRFVTNVVCNLRGWMAVEKTAHPAQFLAAHTDYIATSCEAARQQRGTAEFFRGDHVMLSFNAARINSQHAQRACSAALKISTWESPRGEHGTLGLQLFASCGVSTSNCMVGAMGAAGLRSYGIVGPASTLVLLCERVATKWQMGVITEGVTVGECRHCFNCRIMCAVQCPKIPASSTKVLWQILGEDRRNMNNDEWMYQLADRKDPYAVHNAAAEALMQGEKRKALEAVNVDTFGTMETLEDIKSLKALVEAAVVTEMSFVFNDAGGVPDTAPMVKARPDPRAAASAVFQPEPGVTTLSQRGFGTASEASAATSAIPIVPINVGNPLIQQDHGEGEHNNQGPHVPQEMEVPTQAEKSL
eukprot:Hpha_TRINITY_DN12400_c0_g1::TRINITY_DN12400_c0_g1_i1::g.42874::m.42874